MREYLEIRPSSKLPLSALNVSDFTTIHQSAAAQSGVGVEQKGLALLHRPLRTTTHGGNFRIVEKNGGRFLRIFEEELTLAIILSAENIFFFLPILSFLFLVLWSGGPGTMPDDDRRLKMQNSASRVRSARDHQDSIAASQFPHIFRGSIFFTWRRHGHPGKTERRDL
jgi:hypothetical protein